MQVTGHRGFKGRYTENTIEGFRKCFDAGASTVETDVWTCKDGVLVVSHDMATDRIYVDESGKRACYSIPDTNYHGVLLQLRTAKNGEPLLRLMDVLTWFVRDVELRDDNSKYRIMLDIKHGNPPCIGRLVIEALLAAHNDIAWWFPRILFAVRSLAAVKYMNQDAFFATVFTGVCGELGYTQFDILYLSVAWQDTIHYLDYNCYVQTQGIKRAGIPVRITGLLMLYVAMWLDRFLDKVVPILTEQKLKLYAWTVNTASQYEFVEAVREQGQLCECGVISDWPDFMVAYQQRGNTPPRGNKIRLSLKQRAMHWVYEMVRRAAGVGRKAAEEPSFDSVVDANAISTVKAPRVYAWLFQKCQQCGIF